jgi:hypothetical protein
MHRFIFAETRMLRTQRGLTRLGIAAPGQMWGGDAGAFLLRSVVEVRPEVLDVDAVVGGGVAAGAGMLWNR